MSHKAKAKAKYLDFGLKDQGQGQGLTSLVKPREIKPHIAGWPVRILYRTIDCATMDATQHFSKTGLGILYPLCTKPTSMMKCGQGVVCVEGRKRLEIGTWFQGHVT